MAATVVVSDKAAQILDLLPQLMAASPGCSATTGWRFADLLRQPLDWTSPFG
jgi:hypothetical protein